MSIDPASGFETTPEARLAGRLAELDRRLREAPPAAAGGGMATDVVARSSGGMVDAGTGPYVTLTVPEPGAFVQAYAEIEVRATANASAPPGSGGWLARARIVDSVYEAGTDQDDEFPGISIDVLYPFNGIGYPTGWTRARQKASAKGYTGANGADPGPGVMLMQWANPGVRTYKLLVGLDGVGGGERAEFRNRRLFARVVA